MRAGKPTSIGRLLDRLLEQKKWRQGIKAAQLRLEWAEIVGPHIAEHAKPGTLHGKRLIVECDHDVWRTELAYLKPELLKRIAEAMGEDVVKEIWLK